MNDFFQELALNAKRVREKYNMNQANEIIGEEIVQLINENRPDLAELEREELFFQVWNSLPDSPMWITEARKIITSFNRKEEHAY